MGEFEMTKAHEQLSAQCFNKAWEFLEKETRTPAEDEEMLRTSMASCWHWTQREDCTDQHLSIAYWQLSRIHAVLGRRNEAHRYAELCLAAAHGEDVAPFALAWAYEALARAESAGSNEDKKNAYIVQAKEAAEAMDDADNKKMLFDELAAIR